MLVALSTSGNSQNVLNALKASMVLNVHTISLLGNQGGECIDYTQLPIIVPSNSTVRIQEAHTLIGHILCDLIETELDLV